MVEYSYENHQVFVSYQFELLNLPCLQGQSWKRHCLLEDQAVVAQSESGPRYPHGQFIIFHQLQALPLSGHAP